MTGLFIMKLYIPSKVLFFPFWVKDIHYKSFKKRIFILAYEYVNQYPACDMPTFRGARKIGGGGYLTSVIFAASGEYGRSLLVDARHLLVNPP